MQIPIWKSDLHDKSRAHINFGDDSIHWESVTQSIFKPHAILPKPPPSEYELLEKKQSTVLNNLDLELESIRSVQKSGRMNFYLKYKYVLRFHTK